MTQNKKRFVEIIEETLLSKVFLQINRDTLHTWHTWVLVILILYYHFMPVSLRPF